MYYIYFPVCTYIRVYTGHAICSVWIKSIVSALCTAATTVISSCTGLFNTESYSSVFLEGWFHREGLQPLGETSSCGVSE